MVKISIQFQSLTDYEVVKVRKPSQDVAQHPAESPSSPTKLFSPEIASLDQAKNHKIGLLFKAIEQGDVPLVFQFFIILI
jgi:hypothetical protein